MGPFYTPISSDFFDGIGDFFEDIGDSISDTASDFFEDQWENGNIQKAILAASVVASGGAFAGFMTLGGFAGLTGGALVSGIATTVNFAAAGVSAYETFSGDQIGDGTFGQVLGAAAAVTGGFAGGFTPAGAWSGSRTGLLSTADGLVSGYEIATGDTIGDGTFSSILNVAPFGAPPQAVFRYGRSSLNCELCESASREDFERVLRCLTLCDMGDEGHSEQARLALHDRTPVGGESLSHPPS